jgi:pyruvate-ferredoxin/flavodoxin oxidoreductase
MCSLVCPHGVVRPFLLDEKETMDAPESVTRNLVDANIKDKDYKFTIGVSLKDCTGCGLCTEVCPGKNGAKALVMKMKEELYADNKDKEAKYLFKEVTEKKDAMPKSTIKGSQFIKPKFEFPGACAGCGETPYLKLLTQLFGDELVISNATGCSSIYGGSIPATSYSIPWANSLFEDNAEFGYGIELADKFHKERIKKLLTENLDAVPEQYKALVTQYCENPDYETSCALYDVVDSLNISDVSALKEFIKTKSLWIVGGDGWAYDIGYNGLDHVLSNRENVNVLVLDTEVYSNTGGQSSKSSKVGSVAKFTATGKTVAKKDLAKIALTYPHVYVATISLGANPMQAIKAFTEAKNYNGPSIIVAYAPCIAQGLKAGMGDSTGEEKRATEAGYFPIFRYNPETKEFSLDSKADFSKYAEFLDGETRYASLATVNKDEKDKLYEQNQKNAEGRYAYYESLNKKES